jgi:N-acetylmuramoyl-L-alanine amidase
MLNVRSGPGLAYSVISYLPYGQSVGILGRDANSGWIKVQTPAGPMGWIHSDYTQMNTTLSALPVIGSTGVPTAGTAVVISNGLNVRSGAGTNYTVLTGVYYGTTLDVLGRNTDGTWLKIQTPGGVVGWVFSAYISPTIAISQIAVTN